MAPKGRFLSEGPTEEWRRYQRQYMREGAHRTDERDRAGSRHVYYPCCGKRRAQCKCDWSSIEGRLEQDQWINFAGTFDHQLLTLNDTQDCGPLRRELADAGIENGGRLWAICCMVRYFSNPSLWEQLKVAGAVDLSKLQNLHATSPIDGTKCQKVLEQAWDSRTPVFGPGRRALPLQAHIGKEGQWIALPAANSKQRAARDTKCLELFWLFRPREAARLMNRPSQAAFAALLAAWQETLTHKLKGFSQYFTKCVLDLFMPCSGLPDVVIGWAWPTDCPGYMAALEVLVPGLPKEELMKFLLFVHIRPATTTSPETSQSQQQ